MDRSRVALAAAAALAACASPQLTRRAHPVARGCSVRADGAAILCGGAAFATLECAPAYGATCRGLALRYADGDVAQLYAASGDPKFDGASNISTAPDGSRIWFRVTEGMFSPSTRWLEYDVGRGKLWSLRDGEAESASDAARAVPLTLR